ncbi:hypothetical protein JCM33374_g5532 [Metschnikowia sp. JCM 33374]|nr:hypothetical protein JCM33374_g5532 [Metschnikowia sp. JCM 33374]
MAKGIRTKPCSNCKRSKVKCEYDKSLPCVRCINNGLASSCHFVFKLPALNFPSISPSQTNKPYEPQQTPIHAASKSSATIYNTVNTLPTLKAMPNPSSNPVPKPLPSPLPPMARTTTTPKSKHVPLHPKPTPVVPETSEFEWRSSMESKLNSVDAKFNDILNVLQANQRALTAGRDPRPKHPTSSEKAQERMERSTKDGRSEYLASPHNPAKRRDSSDEDEAACKRSKYGPADFRDNVITMDDARILFKFFDENIAQQLFGFEIKKFSLDVIWESSPILVCTICTIASMHYPGQEIASKQELLQKHLRELCTGVLFASRPKTEQEAFNTIVSLVLCSFWLSDSQMFTGIALQLAKDFNLSRPTRGDQRKSSICEQDRIKLWYLLFILDGQQSMTFNRQSLVSNDDYALRNPRQLLMKEEPKKLEDSNKVSNDDDQSVRQKFSPKNKDHTKLTDLRLVSQVEYNLALSESFKGNAWDLLAPKSFGIPSRSNLELDKWMVSWTVLLAPMNNGAVWSSKSTLIYYNFAKMHINSSVIRQLQEDRGGETILLPNWKNYKTPDPNETHSPSALANKEPEQDSGDEEEEEDSDDEDEEDDFVSNSGLVTQDQALVSYNIAVNAAQTVLNLVLSDPDISNNLKYVPVHIHMMLYYAAILLVSPPALAREGDSETVKYFSDVIAKLRIVRSLQNKVYLNLPTDRSFGDQLLKNLENLFEERISRLMSELHASSLNISQKADLINEISMLQFTSTVQHSVSTSLEVSSRENSPRPERISAWPGSHHGHP